MESMSRVPITCEVVRLSGISNVRVARSGKQAVKMKQKYPKFGAFDADPLARLHVSDLQTLIEPLILQRRAPNAKRLSV